MHQIWPSASPPMRAGFARQNMQRLVTVKEERLRDVGLGRALGVREG